MFTPVPTYYVIFLNGNERGKDGRQVQRVRPRPRNVKQRTWATLPAVQAYVATVPEFRMPVIVTNELPTVEVSF